MPRNPDTHRALGIASLAVLVAASVTLVATATGGGDAFVIGGAHGPHWLLGPLRWLKLDWGKDGVFLSAIAMFAGYLGLLAFRSALSARAVIGTIVALHVLFVLAPILLSGDVFFYIGLGRLWALDHIDPYAFGRIAGQHANQVSVYTGTWAALPSTYGPVFIALSGALALLGVTASVWAFKVIAGLAGLATIWLVWDAAGRLGRDRLAAVILVGANPLWLAWTVGGAHNDTLMMALVMGAVVLVLRGSERASGAVLAVGVGLKLAVGPFAAFVVLGARRRLRAVAGAVGVGAALLAVGFALFPSSWLGHWYAQSQDQARISGPGPLMHLMGFLRVDSNPVPQSVRIAVELAGVAIVLALLVRTWRDGDWLTNAGWAALVILVTSSWLREWYFAWLLPLAALSPSRRLLWATLALSAFVMLTAQRWVLELIFLRLL
jgi:hypothetical protein